MRRKLDWERPVPRDVLERCIDVAVQAPTGANAEAWRFLVLDEPGPKARVAELYARAMERYAAMRPGAEGPKPTAVGLAERLGEMPALILVCSEGRPLVDNNAMHVAFYGSVLPAAWSLMVALRARGLGRHLDDAAPRSRGGGGTGTGDPRRRHPDRVVAGRVDEGSPAATGRPTAARDVTFWNRWGER